MKKKVPYIITCVQCPAYLKKGPSSEHESRCLHILRDLTREEEIYIPDWCPLPNLEKNDD